MEKIISLLTRISELYAIPQWIVDSGAIAICIILIAFPFLARYLMQPKYYKFRELILFKVLWRWKYKKGDIIGLWCYCPKCQNMLMCDDENCRSEETLQHKITYFICPDCGGNELSRVVGGDRRYGVSLVKREIWRHIRAGSYNEVATATKEALTIYAKLEEEKAALATTLEEKMESVEASMEVAQPDVEADHSTHKNEDILPLEDAKEGIASDTSIGEKEAIAIPVNDINKKEITKDGV